MMKMQNDPYKNFYIKGWEDAQAGKKSRVPQNYKLSYASGRYDLVSGKKTDMRINNMKRVIWTDWGPEIKYDGNILHVEDINPHRVIKWKLSRVEIFKMGLALILGAAFHKEK